MAAPSLIDHVTDLHVEAPLPTMYRVRQHFDAPDVGDIPAAVARQLTALDGRIEPGMRVGVTAGSRGLANIPVILRAVGNEIRQRGGHPFIIPAMGSHGGATAAGQEEVLESYGITERTTAMPIVSAMDVQQIGQLPDGPAVYMSTTALEADALLIVGRVKPHTDFRADIESGLAKIMVIGLGKHRGAQMIHSYGTAGLSRSLAPAAQVMVQHANVLGALAILENAYDDTAKLEFVEADGIGGPHETRLLNEARSLMASLPFDEIDVLVVQEMGKNISGTGMDTNIIGRMMIHNVAEFERPRIRIITVLDLTEEAHGNGAGIGLADLLSRRAVEKLDLRATYINGFTSGIGGVQRIKLPAFLPTDLDTIAAGILGCGRGDPQNARVVVIRNTLELSDLYISASLLDEAESHPRLDITDASAKLPFDESGALNLWAAVPVHA